MNNLGYNFCSLDCNVFLHVLHRNNRIIYSDFGMCEVFLGFFDILHLDLSIAFSSISINQRWNYTRTNCKYRTVDKLVIDKFIQFILSRVLRWSIDFKPWLKRYSNRLYRLRLHFLHIKHSFFLDHHQTHHLQ